MRILHIMNYYMEGMGYQENWLPYYQKQQGHEVQIVTSDKYFPFPNYTQTMEKKLGDRNLHTGVYVDKGVEVIRKRSWLEIPGRAIILFSSLLQIKKFKPDVIHLHGITNPNLLFIFPFLAFSKIKLVIDSHTDYQVVRHQTLLNKIYYKMWGLFYKVISWKVNKYLPITEEAKEFLECELSLQPAKIALNHLGVDLKSVSYNSARGLELRETYNITHKDIVFVNAGKQYPGKRIDFIIKLYKKFKTTQKHQGAKLFLIGNATQDYNNYLDQMIGTDPDVYRIPFLDRDKLVDFYSMADIGIWPGVPSNTIQEAMACKVALILPDNKTVSHLIAGNGLTFNSETPEELADQLVSLLSNKSIEDLKGESYNIIKRYSWENIARESLEIYEQN